MMLKLDWIDSAVVDAWASGERLEEITDCPEDAAFAETVSRGLFERSARCMCTNLAAIVLLSGETEADICAEGSLVQKGRVYRPMLESLIRSEIEEKLGRRVHFRLGNETTLSGSAAAALLNL